MSTRWKIMLFGAVVTVGLLVSYLLLCGNSYYMHVKITLGNRESMRFQIESLGVNGIKSIRFYSRTSGEDLWSVKVWTCPIDHFTYGVDPVCNPNSVNAKAVKDPVKQIFPEQGRLPRKIEVGETFVVEIVFQYDDFFAASVGTKRFTFRCLSETEVVELGAVEE